MINGRLVGWARGETRPSSGAKISKTRFEWERGGSRMISKFLACVLVILWTEMRDTGD